MILPEYKMINVKNECSTVKSLCLRSFLTYFYNHVVLMFQNGHFAKQDKHC